MGTRVVFAPQGELLERVLDAEAAIFGDYYQNTRAELAETYAPYRDRTVFVAVVEPAGRVGAVMRVCAPGSAGGVFTLNAVGQDPWRVDPVVTARLAGLDPARTWDISTIGVRRDAGRPDGVRRGVFAVGLYRGLELVRQANDMRSFVGILDRFALRAQLVLGLKQDPLPGTGPAPFLGSASSTPVFSHTREMLAYQRERFPQAYRDVTCGESLVGVVDVPPVEEFVLPWSTGSLPVAA